jgi:hypothetical protein
MNEAIIKRIKYLVILLVTLLVPFLLARTLRTSYISSPEYAFHSFIEAVRSKNTEAAIRLCTPKYLAFSKSVAMHNGYAANPFSFERSWVSGMPHTPNLVWRTPDFSHAVVTYNMNQGGYYSYYLLKTKAGWKVDELSFALCAP